MGKSKKAAESEAAEAALKKLREAGPKVPPEEDSVAI
jgi:dsRNA-specific ribonuclease